MNLTQIVKDRIREQGPISFHDFMETALYHPQSGYYTSSDERIGKNGDYYTSPYLTSLFGEMIAKQMEEMWRLLGKEDFTIVEYGAGQGSLCADILRELEKNPKMYDRLNYCIIEKSPAMRWKQRDLLPEKVSWHESIEELNGIRGCILSNELLDNFAVHRVVMEDDLKEIFVDYDGGFREIALPADDALKTYLGQLNISLPRKYHTEINLEATDWIRDNAGALAEGYIITIDYGFPSAELYRRDRRDGNIVCYHRHSINSNPYDHIGEQDITAHINFSALHHWGLKYGLQTCGYTSQANFLHAMGLVAHLRKLEEEGKHMQSGNREKLFLIHTLLLDMGQRFKVLIQQKGCKRVGLSGMRFAQPIS